MKSEHNTVIPGGTIKLVPAGLEHRRDVYEWCFHSDTTQSHSGPPHFPDVPIPTYEEFCASDHEGYEDYYFTGSQPKDGRGFLIVTGKEPVGFISYCSFHLKPGLAELDIWMSSEAHCGKGYGVDAVRSLGDYLNKAMGIHTLIIAPSIKNARAVRAYEKAGFRKTDKPMREFLLEEYIPLYGSGTYGVDETAILVKQFDMR